MPQSESFWNPYRWVQVGDQPVKRDAPQYHHQLSGLSGRLWCELQALTPLIIGDGKGEFVRRQPGNRPYIPATSLKGAMRSLAEVVGNAAVPFGQADAGHASGQAASDRPGNWQLDVVARMFGYLDRGDVFAGLVHFSDAVWMDDESPPLTGWPTFKVAGGQPDPKHQPFYPDKQRRKFYHHQTDATSLTPPHVGIKEDQKRTMRPAPPDSRFAFTTDFRNLREEELELLLYCLVLENKVTVTLSAAALGPGAREPVTLTGPLRHKLGGCKPQGAGSAQIRVTKLLLRSDPAARYRGETAEQVLDGQPLDDQLLRRTANIRRRTDKTMQQFRAMLIYSADDPRCTDINYPSYPWFQTERSTGARTPLKPTT